ncbi:hypothetical protein PMNALOAF_2735 [Methylobacterium adhaesivum]|nr:hypothetical protein PMNALOAF_2735 [Methylobacterium adhaesivum]
MLRALARDAFELVCLASFALGVACVSYAFTHP